MDPFMQAAVAEAQLGRGQGGVPIGSVLVHRGRIIGRGHNQRMQKGSAVLHGEMDALENAGRQPASVYRDSVLYTTLSPCPMCSGAILLYGIPRVVVGENASFMGEEELLRSRGVAVEVLQDPDCIRLMSDFMREHPDVWHEDIGCEHASPAQEAADPPVRAHASEVPHMSAVVSPANVAAALTELWSPRVVGEVDDAYVKVAKVKGTLAWHSHDEEDELFYVLAGHLRIEMEQRSVELDAGEMFVVPRGVRHNPVAEDETHLLLIERKSTRHTGDVTTDRTRSLEEQLRPV